MDLQQPAVTCWVCSVLIGVPYVDLQPAEVFKCGWCGAINKPSQQQYLYPDTHQRHQESVLQQRPHDQQPLLTQLSIEQQQNPQQNQPTYTELSAAVDTELTFRSLGEGYAQLRPQQRLEQHQEERQRRPFPQQQLTQLQPQQWQLHFSNEAGWTTQHCHTPQYQILSAADAVNTKPNSKCRNLLQACRRCICFLWRWLIIWLVLTIISSVTGVGVLMLLPRLCTTPFTYLPNLAVAALLVFNVLFYYAASVLQSPGSVAVWVPAPARGPAGDVLQGSYDMYMFCEHCQAPKPPSAHHCSTCGTCVVEMDHHCPFINNCVGRGNLRPFLLFLAWTLIAACYILVLCSILLFQNIDMLRSSIHSSSRLAMLESGSSQLSNQDQDTQIPGNNNSTSRGTWMNDANGTKTGVSGLAAATTSLTAPSAPTAGVSFPNSSNWLLLVTRVAVVLLQYAPGWLLAAYYLIAASVALLLAVSVLLWSQVNYLSRGVTYIEHLKGKGAAGSAGQNKEQQQLLSDGGLSATLVTGFATKRRELLWAKLFAVLGVARSSWWSYAAAVLIPRWRDPVITAGAAAGKKRS